jgi:hypothetical protein
MTDEFAPPGGARIDYNQINGRLLLIEPTTLEEDVPTVNGIAKYAIRADVTILDGPTAGAVLSDTLIFPKVLTGQLRSRIGQKVLGRLGQGAAQPGKNPPWTLSRATDADTKIGKAYLAGAMVDADVPPF